MKIRLLKPLAVFYPPRTEPVGSVVSIGNPKGRQLIAAGVAEELTPEQDDIERLRQKARERQGGKPLWDDEPQAMQSGHRPMAATESVNSRAAKRAAAVAMLVKAGQPRHSTIRRSR